MFYQTNQVTDILWNETTLYTNQFLRSTTGRFYARVQEDGNFVCYESSDFQGKNAFWSSQSYGKGVGPYTLIMQNDGNLVLYDRNNQPTWASDTWSKGVAPFRLVMQNDRNLVIYDRNNQATWSTNTYIRALDILGNDKVLDQNAFLVSNNHRFFARMQDDGNFVLYHGPDFQSKNAVWATNTGGVGNAPFKLTVQNDGNMCIYDRNGTPTWASNTWNQGTAPYHLVVQDDRNLVLYDNFNKAIWASNTNLNNVFNTLDNEHAMHQNGFLQSKNGKYYARMQDDGNFVLYQSNKFIPSNAIWASNTGGKGKAPFKVIPQSDGNLCVYDGTGTCTWASNTWNKGTPPFHLVMKDDRNLVLYDRTGTPTWATDTYI